MMVVILLGAPLAVIEVRSVDQSDKNVISTEARLLAQTVIMAMSKANPNPSPIPLDSYQPDFTRMIQTDHYAKIVVDGQNPLYLNGEPGATPVFSANSHMASQYKNVGVTVTVMAPKKPAQDQIRKSLFLIGGVALAVLIAATGM